MSFRKSNAKSSGFSLIELMVAMAVLAIIGIVMVSITDSVQRVSRQTMAHAEEFRESRRAFDRINQRLSQATLNTYYDYVGTNGMPRTATSANFTPFKYARISELRYLQTNASAFTAPRGGTMIGQTVFFQAPLGQTDTNTLSGLNSLLNTVGYYIEKGSDDGLRPPTATNSSDRFRLFEFVQPTENLSIYSKTSAAATYAGTDWATSALAASGNSHRLADNIVALVFRAIYPDSSGIWQTNTSYSSAPRNQTSQAIEENNLPPKVGVTMIAVDEVSAQRIAEMNLSLMDAKSETELRQLEQQLSDHRLGFRRFESVVSIGPAKWSTK